MQSLNQIQDNLLMVKDENNNVCGTAFLINFRGNNYCLTSQYAISSKKKLFVGKGQNVLLVEAKVSDSSTGHVSILQLESLVTKPLDYAEESFRNVPDYLLEIIGKIPGFVCGFEEKIAKLPVKVESDLCLLTSNAKLNLSSIWDKKDPVCRGAKSHQQRLYTIPGRSALLMGSPVCRRLDGLVVGIILTITDECTYVLSMDTILELIADKDLIKYQWIDEVDFLVEKANKLGLLNRYAKAIDCYDQIIKNPKYVKDPNYPIALVNKGVVFSNLGKFDEAVTTFSLAVTVDPQYVKAWWYMGEAFARLGKFADAITCYDKALEIDPDNYPEVWFSKANLLMKEQRTEGAVTCYKMSVKIDPRNFKAWHNLGLAHTMSKQYDEAMQYFDYVLAIRPKDTNALMNKGIIYRELKQFDIALDCFRRLLQIEPERSEAWNNFGIVLSEMGNYRKAIEAYNKALDIDPKNAKAWFDLGLDFQKLGMPEDSRGCFEMAGELGYTGGTPRVVDWI